MRRTAICLKFELDSYIPCLRNVLPCAVTRARWFAGMLSLARCLAIATVLFAGTSALAQSTYTVTSTADTAGSCSGLSCTTLRAAIFEANLSSGNTIQFQTGLTGTITLTSALPGITSSMTITGPGATVMTISGANTQYILNINSTSATVAISGLTFANGANAFGGAIYNSGALTLAYATFSGNSGGSGGAIYSSGTLTVTNSIFTGNSASNGDGAINSVGKATISNSTFSGNSATSLNGAIGNSGTMTVTNSTFSGNSASNFGAIGNAATMTVTNSTFSGNSASHGGGAIGNGSTLTANNNIFVGNSAGSSSNAGAGISTLGATANAAYNLFYRNLNGSGSEDDCNSCMSNTNAITGLNPNLLPLGNYGGPTQTLLPQPGSPAICAGSYADVPNGVTTDQRGFPLSSSTCSNGGVDVGAVQSDYITVTTMADSNDGSCTASLCSLRDAITAANANSYGGDIGFSASVTGTITLASALPTIAQSMAIIGPGASNLTVSGNNAYRILIIYSTATVTVSGLTLANGRGLATNGGAILNDGALTVSNSAFFGNWTSGGGIGGAIDNDTSGTLTVTNSTFSGNSAMGNYATAGAILNEGKLTLANSTFSGNSAGEFGGAILSQGTMTATGSTFSGNTSGEYGGAIALETQPATVTDSTFSGNTSAYLGGAVYVYFGTPVTIDNNIFTKNSAYSSGGAGIWNGGTTNASYNLYYQNLDTGGTEDDCNNCTTNTFTITGSNPLLAALGSYGGITQSMLPQPGSPAICGGSTALIPSGVTTDERGFSRTTTYSSNTCLDLGAVQTDYTAVAFSSSSYNGITNQAVSPAPVVTVTENGQTIGGVPILLAYSGSGSPAGLGPFTTAAGTGAAFSSLESSTVAAGTLSVSLPITAAGNSIQPAPLTASASLNIQAATSLSIAATHSSPIFQAGPGVIVLTVTNSGLATAGTATVADVIPSAFKINSADTGCTISAQTVTCTIAPGMAGSTAFHVYVTVSSTASTSGIANTATLADSTDAIATANSTDTIAVSAQAALADSSLTQISISGSMNGNVNCLPYMAGKTLTASVVVMNSSSPAVTLTNPYATNISMTGGNSLLWDVASATSVAPNTGVTFNFDIQLASCSRFYIRFDADSN